MALFTMALKSAIDFSGGEIAYQPVVYDGITYGKLPVMTGGDIGLNDYPLFNSNYRAVLNGKIIDRFWNREIGMETIEDFRLNIRRRMNEIMPFYNKLYQTEQIPYDALKTVDIKTTSNNTQEGNEETSGTSNATGNSNSVSRTTSSTMPQTMLSANEDYASSGVDANSQSESESDNTQQGTAHNENTAIGESETTGYQGVPADLVMRFRDSLLNIDTMIIANLEDCFMLLLGNGDSYTNERYYL